MVTTRSFPAMAMTTSPPVRAMTVSTAVPAWTARGSAVASGDFAVTKTGDVYTIVSAEGVDTVTNVEEFIFGDTTLSAADMDALAELHAGDPLLVGGAGNDDLTGTDGADTIHGGVGDNTIDAGDDDDWINAGDDNDLIFSGRGNDTTIPGAGNDSIDGGNDDGPVRGDGTDIDQVRFGVALGDATVTKRGAFYFIVSPEGADVVTQVEEFVFGDTTLTAADMDAIAGTTDRLLTGTDDNDNALFRFRQ